MRSQILHSLALAALAACALASCRSTDADERPSARASRDEEDERSWLGYLFFGPKRDSYEEEDEPRKEPARVAERRREPEKKKPPAHTEPQRTQPERDEKPWWEKTAPAKKPEVAQPVVAQPEKREPVAAPREEQPSTAPLAQPERPKPTPPPEIVPAEKLPAAEPTTEKPSDVARVEPPRAAVPQPTPPPAVEPPPRAEPAPPAALPEPEPKPASIEPMLVPTPPDDDPLENRLRGNEPWWEKGSDLEDEPLPRDDLLEERLRDNEPFWKTQPSEPQEPRGGFRAERGWYVGALVGTTQHSERDFDGQQALVAADTIALPEIDAGSGPGAVLGYRFASSAFELEYLQTMHDGSWTNVAFDVEYEAVSVGFKHYLWRERRVQPYLTLGFGMSRLTVENGSFNATAADDVVFENGIHGKAGAGVALFLTERIALQGHVTYRFLETYDEVESVAGKSTISGVEDGGFAGVLALTYTF